MTPEGARLDRFLDNTITEFNETRPRMSKLAAIADRIARKKAEHDAKADEWAKRLDDIEKREPEVFAVGEHAVASREVDLKDMEETMRALGNLGPLQGDGSGPQS